MGCNDKIKHKCGTKNYATCIDYEIPTPEFSDLYEETCITLSDTTEDVYTLIGGILQQLNVSSITSECEGLPSTKTILTLIQYLVDTVCAQQAQIDALVDQNG